MKALESQADIYIVMLGTNDILKDGNAESKIDSIKEGYQILAK